MKRFTTILLLAFITWACQEEEAKVKPKMLPLTESVYGSVTIESQDQYQVFAPNGGIIQELLVNEGDMVKAGQLLVKIKNTRSQVEVANSELAVSLAKEQYAGRASMLESMKQELNRAKLTLANDSVNYQRQKRLWEQKIGSREALDKKKLQYELSISQISQLEKEIARTEQELGIQLKRSENSLKASRSNASDYSVYSNIEGMVFRLFKEKGEAISPQEPLCIIGRKNEFVVLLSIDEVDIAKIKLEQKVIVALDAYSGQTFEAKISKINPYKNEQNQTFEVEAKFVNAPSKLYLGLSGEGNIIITEKPKVLTIPIEYLTEKGEVNTPEGLKKVELGIRNMERAEILSGIDTSTVLLLPEK